MGFKIQQKEVNSMGSGLTAIVLAGGKATRMGGACDKAFLKISNETIIDHMVVPKIDEKYHPLFGIYSKDCIPAIKEAIKQGELHVMNIFSKVKSRFLARHEIERFDGRLVSLMNINTKEDYEACLAKR